MTGFLQLPARFTPALSERLASDGPRLRRFIERHWVNPETGGLLRFDPWQAWLIDRILELRPDGGLRFRQVLVSMGRQNGKSVLAAVLGLYGLLLHERSPLVVGVASSVEQSRIVYDRTRQAVEASPLLSSLIHTTGTRGLSLRDGSGTYSLKAAKGAALQGLPISLGLFDELHISKPEMWDAIVNGQRTRANGLLVGITTAGDDSSELLHRLYRQADEPSDTFGAFVWEAPSGSTIEDDAAVYAANPAVAAGRIPIERVRADARPLPVQDQERFTLNRFTSGTAATWMEPPRWRAAGTGGIPADADLDGIVWGIDITSDGDLGYVSATVRHDGRYYSELAARLVNPSPEAVADVCDRLYGAHGGVFACDGWQRSIVATLRAKGLTVYGLSRSEIPDASSALYRLAATGELSHAGDPSVTEASNRAIRRNSGDHWRISRTDSGTNISALLATCWGVYICERLAADDGPLLIVSNKEKRSA